MDSSAPTGLMVAAIVIAASVGYGLWRRQHAGRLRPAPSSPARQTAAMAAPEGGTEPNRPRLPDRSVPDGAAVKKTDPALLASLGVAAGAPVTLLQFSSAFCVPCRATRRVLADVAALLEGVHHVEVDAESHLDAVRALGIWRTPTVLVVDATGRIVQRATGVPVKAQVIAALGPLLPDAPG